MEEIEEKKYKFSITIHPMEEIGEDEYTFQRTRDDRSLYIVNEAGKAVYDECNKKLRLVEELRMACRVFELTAEWIATYCGRDLVQKCITEDILIIPLILKKVYAQLNSAIPSEGNDQQPRKLIQKKKKVWRKKQ